MRAPLFVRRCTASLLLPLSLALIAAGCAYGGEDRPRPRDAAADGAADAPAPADPRAALIHAAGRFPEPPTSVPATLTGMPTTEEVMYGDDEVWRCTVRRYSVQDNADAFVTFEPAAAVIWPGSLVQGRTLATGNPEPIPVRRGSGTIVMNLLNAGMGSGARSYQRQLPEVAQGNVIDAQNEILSSNVGSTPAAFSFESSRVDSREQLAFSLRVRAEWLTGSVDSSLRFSTDHRYTRFIVRLTQRYFTMVYQTPTTLDEVLHPSVTAEELARYVGPGNPAAYISSVTYGRQFFLLFESTSSAEDLEASLNFVWNGGLASASAEARLAYQRTQQNTIIRAFAVGGAADTALNAAISAATTDGAGRFDRLRDYIVAGGNFSASNPGLPLSYVVRSLANNEVARVDLATTYTTRECVPQVAARYQVLWLRADALMGADGTPVTRWPGSAVVANDGMSGNAVLRPTGINGHPSVYFAPTATGFAVDGGHFVNSDYTIAAVVRNPDSALGGAGRWPSAVLASDTLGFNATQGMMIGYGNGTTLGWNHGQQGALSSTITRAEGGDVVTVRHSAADGTAIYLNGLERATNAMRTAHLTANTGLRVGGGSMRLLLPIGSDTRDVRFVGHIGEVRGFTTAVAELQRRAVECELGDRFGIRVANCNGPRPSGSY